MEEQRLWKKKKQAQQDFNWKVIAETSNKLGAIYNDSGSYEEAKEQFQDELEAYKRLGSVMDAGRAERMIGEMLMLLGEYEQALKHEQSYLRAAQEEQDQVEQQRAYATIGRIHLVHAQSEDTVQAQRKPLALAEKAFLEAVLLCKSLVKQVGRHQAADMEARIYLNLGVCKEISEDFEEAAEYMQTAIQIAKKFELHDLLHQCYFSVGLMHSLKTGDSSKALLMFNLALQVAERLPDKVQKSCETLYAKAEVCLKTGDGLSAKQPLKKAFRLKCTDKNLRASIESTLKVVIALERAQEKLINLESQEYGTQKRLYETLGDGWCKLGNYSKAIEYYLKMLECAELDGEYGKSLMPIYVSLYQTYKDNKQYELALEFMQKEHNLVKDDPQEAFVTLMNIAEVQELAQQRFFDIENSYRQARAMAKTVGDVLGEKRILTRWLKLCKDSGMGMNEEELLESMKSDGITVESLKDISEPDSQEVQSETDTPNIGDEISLENELSSDEETSARDANRSLRKRATTSLAVKKNAKGETQLHIACINGDIRLVRQLLDQGHPTMVRDNAGWLPLHEAANHGFKEIVEAILDRDNAKGINDKGGPACDGITPLYDACCNGNLEIIELLLERGADPTIKTDAGDSTLDALTNWRQTARLDDAEEALYSTLKHKLKQSLVKTGNLNTSKESRNSSRRSDPNDLESIATSSRSSGSHRSGLRLRDIRNGIDSSDSDNDSGIAYKKPVKSPKRYSNEEKQARSDYKQVMSRLRNPHPVTYSPQVVESQKKRPALLEVNEVVEDDWLEDDLGPKMKKQKFMPETFTSSKRRSDLIPKPSPMKSNNSQEPSSTVDWGDFADPFNIEDVPLWQQSGNQFSPAKFSKSSPKKSVRKSQTSLLEAGFSRTQSPVTVDSVPDSTVHEPVVTVVQNFPSNFHEKATIKSIPVRIENELISVPVRTDEIERLEIGWLVKEVIRRYSNLFGRHPEIRLTLDGALVETTDPLVLVNNTTEICARILKFSTISIRERYQTACHENKQQPIDEAVSALEMCVTSKKFKLEDQCLTNLEIMPMCVALKQEIELNSINLGNNWIQDEGVRCVSECVVDLKVLQELNLTGNGFGVEGMKHLLRPELNYSMLLKLVLSHNPIGDFGAKILFESGARVLPNLKELQISSCEIRELPRDAKLLCQIMILDLSHNHLTHSGVSPLFTHLNYESIEVLNLNNASAVQKNELNAPDWSRLFDKNFTNLTELHMANLNLTDAIAWKMSTACRCLKILDLSHNNQLTSSTFDRLTSVEVSSGNKACIQKIFFNGCHNILSCPIPAETIAANQQHPEYLELTLNITDNKIRAEQETHIRRLWRKWHSTAMASETHQRDNVKVNKFQLKAYIVDTDYDATH